MGSGRSPGAQRYFLDGHSEILRYLKTHFLLLSLLGICHGLNAADPKRPNIIMILADDLSLIGLGDAIECFGTTFVFDVGDS